MYRRESEQHGGETEERNFIGSLFDLSFSSLISGRALRFLYGLFCIVATGVAFVAIVIGLGGSILQIVLVLVAVPLLYLVFLVSVRISL